MAVSKKTQLSPSRKLFDGTKEPVSRRPEEERLPLSEIKRNVLPGDRRWAFTLHLLIGAD